MILELCGDPETRGRPQHGSNRGACSFDHDTWFAVSIRIVIATEELSN